MPAGIGDVQVYPTHDGVIIELRSGGAAAKLLAHIPDITEFTDRTLELVPLGSEMDHYRPGSRAELDPGARLVRGLTIDRAPVGPDRGGGRPSTACASRQFLLGRGAAGPVEGSGSPSGSAQAE